MRKAWRLPICVAHHDLVKMLSNVQRDVVDHSWETPLPECDGGNEEHDFRSLACTIYSHVELAREPLKWRRQRRDALIVPDPAYRHLYGMNDYAQA
jgi:hypothetical protein